MAAQAGLCLARSETPEDTFCRVVAHFNVCLLGADSRAVPCRRTRGHIDVISSSEISPACSGSISVISEQFMAHVLPEGYVFVSKSGECVSSYSSIPIL